MVVRLFNTLSRSYDDIVVPLDGKTVRLYACGPTVYKSQHIGNYRTYIFEDLLRRSIEYAGFPIRHVMNITDVGHLVGDHDGGEDKFDLSAREQKQSPREIALFYENEFLRDLDTLNILRPHEILRATDAIPEEIDLVRILLEKGFAYVTDLAIYFDVSRLSDYGKLSGQRLEDKQTAVRAEVIEDSEKRNPKDFALWFFLKGRYANHLLHWPSPWGEGFPGWHIECSAISRKLLGQPFDIHAGGVDHIGTHHTNEMAQSEAAYDTPLAKIWMHGEHLETEEKMSKSLGNVITVQDLLKRGIDPLSLRYLSFVTHYRKKIAFSWDSLEQAQHAYHKLLRTVYELGVESNEKPGSVSFRWKEKFLSALVNDLAVPEALAILWQMIKDPALSIEDMYATILDFDAVLGLRLAEKSQMFAVSLDDTLNTLLKDREDARTKKDFARADAIRDELRGLGYEIKDSPEGPTLEKLIS